MRNKLKGWLGLSVASVVWMMANIGHADEGATVYEAIVAVKGQDAAEREAAIGRAFDKVVIKASGVRGRAISDVQSVQQYVEQYRYEPLGEDGKKGLWVRFDQGSIERLLVEKGLSVWGARPSLLIWVAIDDNGRRFLAEGEDFGEVVKKVARTRGVPLLVPLLDIEDQSNVQFTDVWGDFEEAIKTGSRRYDPDGLLVGRIQKVGTRWTSRWSLYEGDTPIRWEGRGGALFSLIEEGVEKGVDAIARAVATTVNNAKSEAGYPHVVVTEIRSLADYSRVVSYLRGLSQVETAYPKELSADRVVFEVNVLQGLQVFIRAVEVGGVLEYVPTDGRGTTFVLVP